MSATCGTFPATMSDDCSGRGSCVSGVCMCEPGWTGLGDWTFTEGQDCQISETAHKVLWGVLMAVYFAIWLWAFPQFYDLYKRQRLRSSTAARSGDRGANTVLSNRAFVTMAVHLLGTTPFAICLGFIELFTSSRVGVGAAATVIFLFMRTCLYSQVYFFQPYLLTTLLGKVGGPKAADLVKQYERRTRVIIGAIIFAGFLSIIPLATQNAKAAAGTYAAYHIIVGFSMAGIFAQSKTLEVNIVEILDASYKSVKKQNILRVKQNLVEAQSGARRQAAFQTLLSFVLGALPLIWNLYGYFLPITFTFPGILFIKVFKTMSDPNKQRRAQGSTSMNTSDATGTSDRLHGTNSGKGRGAQPQNKAHAQVMSRDGYQQSSEGNISVEGEGAYKMNIAGFEGAEAVLSQMPSESDVVYSEEDEQAHLDRVRKGSKPGSQATPSNKTVAVRMSPVMRVINAANPFTPTKKKDRSGRGGFFAEDDDGDADGGEEADPDNDDDDDREVHAIADTPRTRAAKKEDEAK